MVAVPNFVGLPVDVARSEAAGAGLSLSSYDPDGPGLGSRTWPDAFWVTTQDPTPGAIVTRWTAVRITFAGDASTSVRADASGPAPVLFEHAQPADDAAASDESDTR